MRDDYAAEARDEHVTKLDNVLYIIIALVNIKTSKHLSKKNEVWNTARGWNKNTQSVRFFWYRNIRDIYTRLQKRWHLESINCNCKRKSSEYALGILFFPAMYFLLQRIRIVNYWLSWWKWGYCLNTTHKSVGSHRSRFMLSRWQRFCNRVYMRVNVLQWIVNCFFHKLSIKKTWRERKRWPWILERSLPHHFCEGNA